MPLLSDPRLRRGAQELREGRFFEAHEEWEAIWLHSTGEEKTFLQALIQLAAACVHLSRGRNAPGSRLLRLAREKLERYPPVYVGIAVATLRTEIDAVSATIASGGVLPDLARAFTLG